MLKNKEMPAVFKKPSGAIAVAPDFPLFDRLEVRDSGEKNSTLAISFEMGSRPRVVALAFSHGAGGEEVASAVTESLGFRLVDREIIIKAAESARVSPEAIEETEKRRSLLDLIVGAVAAAEPDSLVWDPDWPALSSLSTTCYRPFIFDAIREVAA